MKVLLDHPDPFLLAHGGFQTQIEQTRNGLKAAGVDAEYLRWWDDSQRADVIHYFGRPTASYLDLAHKKNIAFVLAELLTGLGSRSRTSRTLQGLFTRTAQTLLPAELTARMGWECYRAADACIANTEAERELMINIFSAPPGKVHRVPNGVEQCFFSAPCATRDSWLVCTATITERKRVAELAQAATIAQTPIWIIGKPYSESDEYAKKFHRIARQNSKYVRYEGAIEDRTRLATIYRQARGFVLLSTKETMSLSALEAAACELPLCLSDLPWARSSFAHGATFCPIASPERTAPYLRLFYDQAPNLPTPPKPLSWPDVGSLLAQIYRGICRISR